MNNNKMQVKTKILKLKLSKKIILNLNFYKYSKENKMKRHNNNILYNNIILEI